MSYVIGDKTFGDKNEAFSFYERVAEFIVSRAIEKCPVVTGNLQSSFVVVRKGNEPNNIVIMNVCPYAHFVHELIFNRHPVGQAKFLEDAGMEANIMFDVDTSLYVSSATPTGMRSGYAPLILYIDDKKHGYNINKRQKDQGLLFERYQAERRVWFENKMRNIYNKLNQLLADENADIDKMKRYADRLDRALKRDAYERSITPTLRNQMEARVEYAGGPTFDLKNFEKLAVPLSVYHAPSKYNEELISVTDELYKTLCDYNDNDIALDRLAEMAATKPEDWIRRVGFVDYNDIDKSTEAINKLVKDNWYRADEIDTYNTDTHMFKGGMMKALSQSGRLAINTNHNSRVKPSFKENGSYNSQLVSSLFGK